MLFSKKKAQKFNSQDNTITILTIKLKKKFQHCRIILHQIIKISYKKAVFVVIIIIFIIKGLFFNPPSDLNSGKNNSFQDNTIIVERVENRPLPLLVASNSRPHSGAKSQNLKNLLNSSNKKDKLNINNKKKVITVSPKWKQQIRKVLKDSKWEQRINKFESNLVRRARVAAYKKSILRRPYRIGCNIITKINPFNDNIILSQENIIESKNQTNDLIYHPNNKNNDLIVQLGHFKMTIKNVKNANNLTEKVINPEDVEIDMDKITPLTESDADFIVFLLNKTPIEFSEAKNTFQSLTKNKIMTITIMNKKRIFSAVEDFRENQQLRRSLTEDSINKKLKLDKIPTLDELNESNSLSLAKRKQLLDKRKQQRYEFVIVTGSKPYIGIVRQN